MMLMDLPLKSGAYIISPLQDAGRDPLQNYGFMVSYRQSNEVTTRMTTYSIKNIPSVEGTPSSMFSPLSEETSNSLSPSISPPSSPRRPPAQHRASSPASNLRRSTKRNSMLANMLSTVPMGNEAAFACFKALPVDFTKERVGLNGFGFEATDAPASVRKESTCKDDIDRLCTTIREACQAVGVDGKNLILERDIVRCVCRGCRDC